jgi:hypothetical protein
MTLVRPRMWLLSGLICYLALSLVPFWVALRMVLSWVVLFWDTPSWFYDSIIYPSWVTTFIIEFYEFSMSLLELSMRWAVS